MRKNIIFLLVLTISFIACKKNVVQYGDYEIFDASKSLLKINYTSAYRNNAPVRFRLNDKPISGLVTARYPYPGGGYNTSGLSTPDYLQVDPGAYKFTASVPQINDNTIDSLLRYTTNLTFETGKKYSLHIADTAENMKHLLLEDDFTMPDTATSRYRVVNLMPDVSAIDVYCGTLLVAENIKYLTASNYFNLHTSEGTAVWSLRETGTGATGKVLATYNSSNTRLIRRSYTAFAMGYKSITSTSDVRRPFISFYLVR